jgi:hypothetical protein
VSWHGSGVNSVVVVMDFDCEECESCIDEGLPKCDGAWSDDIHTDDRGSIDGSETKCPKCGHLKTIKG